MRRVSILNLSNYVLIFQPTTPRLKCYDVSLNLIAF